MIRALLLSSLALPLLLGCGSVETTGGGGHGGNTTAATATGAGGAATTSAGSSMSTGATTSTGSSTSSGATTSTSTGGATCSPACGAGFTCCGGACVNTANDIHNCGGCGKACLGENMFCAGDTCADPPCDSVMTCTGAEFCCGTECCAAGMLCCEVNMGGPSNGPKCTAPENGTCPKGCPACL